MSTTIDIEFMTNMNTKGQVPPGVRVRIGVPQDSHEDLMVPQQSPRMGRSSQRKGTGRPIEGKSPAHANKPTYDSMFTITAHLPNDLGTDGENRRCKLHCYPGMTVQQVIESEIPNISHRPYLVYQFPSRALLNPEKEASALQDQEIWIEPARIFDPDIGDERLTVVKELYSTEDAYLEHLRNIFDVYMEPLRTWGMPQADMNTLFLSLSRLCDLLMNFFSELELAVKSWNTNTTLIGGVFTQYRSFWDMYIEYAQSYTVAMRLLKQKKNDEAFKKFLDIKRGLAMHTLESLMLLPVQRVSDYHRYLNQLLALTSRDHIDYQNIRHSVARAEEIIQARADELVCLQNESKLDQVQLQFPNDSLFLTEPLNVIEANTRRSKSIGQPPLLLNKPYGNSNPTKYKSSVSCFPTSGNDAIDSGNRKNLRMYLQEGPVKFLVMTKQGIFQSQERYLFLFSDLLLVAKIAHRSRMHQHRCYKLKNRLRLSEMWVEELTSDMQIPQSKSSFILGWPLTNCIAIFSTEAEKVLWLSLISKNVRMQRQLQPSDSITIHVLNMVKSNPGVVVPEFMDVQVSDKAIDILRNGIECFKLNEPEDSYQLWVKIASDKEEPLNGYECPFAIQTHHNRLQLDLSGDARPQQLDFVLKRKVSSSSGHTSKSLLKRIKIKRGTSSKGLLNKIPKQENVKMFGVPLEELIVNNQLPEKLQEILIRLWVDGPNCLGIFRQSASLKKIREMKEVVDGREQMDLSDVSIHVVGALLKELLRNVPGGVLTSARYTEFVATNDIESVEDRVTQIKKVLSKLPQANQVFLRYLLPLLHHISLHETINQMSTTNLSICFAPSLLEPDYSLAVIKNEAPSLVEFMIRHAMDIYNNEVPELFRQFMGEVPESDRDVKLIPIKDEEDTELSEDGFYHRRHRHHRNASLDMGTSASEDSLDEDDMVRPHNGRHALTLVHTSSDSTVQSGPIGRVTLLGNRNEGLLESLEAELTDTEREDDEEDDHISPAYSYFSGRLRHKSGDSTGRRRSVSAETGAVTYASPPSPTRRGFISSSGPHGHSPMFPHRIDHDSDGSGRSGHRSEPGGSTRQKKKRKAGYSNSFSKPSDLKHNEAKIPQSSSASFYDPVDRPRSRSVIAPSVINHNLSDEVLDLVDRNLVRSSNQSISSRGSGSSTSSQTQSRGTQTQLQPSSATSLISNRSNTSSHSAGSLHGGTVGEIQVDPVTGKVDRDSVKQVVSSRFGIKPVEGNKGYESSRSIGEPSIHHKKEGTEPKVIPRAREGIYNPYSRYEANYTNSSLKRQSVASSIDDRPEAEQHLSLSKEDYRNSLSLEGSLNRRGEMIPLGLALSSDNGSRLTIISGGYNSDTESAPSRTLNRPDKKLQEVSGPNSPSSVLPNRYSKSDSAHPLDIPSDRYLMDGGRGRTTSTHEPSSLEYSNQSLTHSMKTSNTSPSPPQKPLHDTISVKKSANLEKTDSRFLDYSSSEERKLAMPTATVTLGKPSEKSRSMPGYTRASITRGPATSNIKTVKVVRYELPTPKKIRRINLRAYNTKK